MKVMHIFPESSHLSFNDLIEEQKKEYEVIHVVLEKAQESNSSKYCIRENGSIIIVRGVEEVLDHQYNHKLRKICDELFKKYKPDIVHIHVFSGSSLLPILNTASSLRIKKILRLNDHSLLYKVKGSFKKIKCIISQCDLITCFSLQQKKIFDKLFGESQKIIYVENLALKLNTIYKKVLNSYGRRLFYKIGNLCNSKCLYCVAGEATEAFIDLKNLIKELESKVADYDCIVFTGGEPTMHPKFFELMAITFYLGFKIEIQSNIRLFSSKKFTTKIQKFNVKIIVCMNSSREDIFDLMANAKGAYKQTVQGARNLIDAGIEVNTKIIITNYNYDHLREIVQFVKAFGINVSMLVFLTPMGFAMKNFKQINLQYRDVLPAVHEALQWGINHNMRMETENIPGCLLDEKYHRYNSEYDEGQKKLDGIYLNVSKGLYNCRTERIEEQKQRVSGCIHCPYFYKCEGVYREYVRNFGEEEFNPTLVGV